MKKRQMEAAAFFRLRNLVYKVFGHAWGMPKSVRDNYRSIEPVNYNPYFGHEFDHVEQEEEQKK